jgi:hypothetical protein
MKKIVSAIHKILNNSKIQFKNAKKNKAIKNELTASEKNIVFNNKYLFYNYCRISLYLTREIT